jgi:hypothetical protein
VAGYTPIYLNQTSIKNIRSINHGGTLLIRNDFTYYQYNQAKKRRIVADCKDWFYKDNDTEDTWEWAPPSESIEKYNMTFEYVAVRYICRGQPEPWKYLTESASGNKYYYNRGLLSKTSARYGELKKLYIASTHVTEKKIVAYASCKRNLIGLFAWADDPGPSGAALDSPDPGSVAEGMLALICGSKEREGNKSSTEKLGPDIHTQNPKSAPEDITSRNIKKISAGS